MPDAFLLLIPGLPLLAALWIATGVTLGWNRGEMGERETAFVATTANGISLLLVWWIGLHHLWAGTAHQVLLFPWLHSGAYQADVSFRLDGLSLSMAMAIALITLLVTRFSVNYLHRETGFQRFFMVLSIFTAAMFVIVLAGSAWLTFVGWELAGASSYLLIAYNWRSPTATGNATRAFVTNRIGDAGFLLGLFMAFTWFHSVEWDMLLATPITSSPPLSSLMIGVTTVGFMLAALVKSAQFPFSAWITRALEGPTPSSTVFYGAVMIHAGIYLLLRIHPLLEQVPALQYTLLLVGLLTMMYGGLGSLAQTDIKTSLLFSTLGQTGLMLVEIALGWYSIALIHLLLHMVWRTYQFLHSPSFALHVEWQAAPVAPTWLHRSRWLHQAALQRFWLDPIADWLFVKPTRALSRETQIFDEQILDKLTGTPTSHCSISTLAQMQALQQGKIRLENSVGVGSGVIGKPTQWLAEQLEQFENRLLLQQNGGKAKRILDKLGVYLERLDRLLTQPRYLVLLIAVTLVVIF